MSVSVWVFLKAPLDIGLRRERRDNAKEAVFSNIDAPMGQGQQVVTGVVHEVGIAGGRELLAVLSWDSMVHCVVPMRKRVDYLVYEERGRRHTAYCASEIHSGKQIVPAEGVFRLQCYPN
jgi:hypothetical protein